MLYKHLSEADLIYRLKSNNLSNKEFLELIKVYYTRFGNKNKANAKIIKGIIRGKSR